MKNSIPFPTKGGSYVYDGKALKHEAPVEVSAAKNAAATSGRIDQQLAPPTKSKRGKNRR